MRVFFFIFILCCSSLSFHAQKNDSLKVPKDSVAAAKLDKKKIYGSARKASILSAVLPGAGQVYNRKYWKVPVIYAGLGGFGYMFWVNNDTYKTVRRNLQAIYDDDTNTVNKTIYSGDQLVKLKATYRTRRDFGAIGFAAIYLLNIIDANVDAHLKTFDVSDDLSMKIAPHYGIYCSEEHLPAFNAGVSFKLMFK